MVSILFSTLPRDDTNLAFYYLFTEFTPVIIDNSNPIENDCDYISIDATRKKMFRDRSPKENYFDQIVTGGQCKSELDDIYKRQDMIK